MKEKYVDILDINFLSVKRNELLDLIEQRVSDEQKTFVITANAEIAIYTKENQHYADLSKKATYIIPDGIGIVKGAKLLNKDIPERIPGVELMVDLIQSAEKNNKKVYFYGAKPDTIEKMVTILKEKYPRLNIIGYHHGYHNDSDNKIMNEVINLKPDYIFVAKGCPLQDEWIVKVLDHVDKGMFMGVGGSFDVISGNVKRAPDMWIKLNLEWLYRIVSDPKRIGRSTAYPRFVMAVMAERLKTKDK